MSSPARSLSQANPRLLKFGNCSAGRSSVTMAGCVATNWPGAFSPTPAPVAAEHPRIRAVWRSQLQSWRAEGRPAAIALIPLLFETDAARHCEATICAACSAKTQRQRLRQRGWNDEQIDQRIAAQLPIEKKMLLADYVVWTEGPLDVLEAQLARIIP